MFIFIDNATKLKLFITSLMAGDFNKSYCKIPWNYEHGRGGGRHLVLNTPIETKIVIYTLSKMTSIHDSLTRDPPLTTTEATEDTVMMYYHSQKLN